MSKEDLIGKVVFTVLETYFWKYDDHRTEKHRTLSAGESLLILCRGEQNQCLYKALDANGCVGFVVGVRVEAR